MRHGRIPRLKDDTAVLLALLLLGALWTQILSFLPLITFALVTLPPLVAGVLLTRSSFRERLSGFMNSALSTLQIEITSLRAQMADKDQRLVALEEKIPLLEAQIADKDREILALRARVADLEALIKVRAAELAAKDDEMSALRDLLHRVELERNALQLALARLKEIPS